MEPPLSVLSRTTRNSFCSKNKWWLEQKNKCWVEPCACWRGGEGGGGKRLQLYAKPRGGTGNRPWTIDSCYDGENPLSLHRNMTISFDQNLEFSNLFRFCKWGRESERRRHIIYICSENKPLLGVALTSAKSSSEIVVIIKGRVQ